MAETQLKHRNQVIEQSHEHEAATSDFDDTNSKHHKSYNRILSILDDEEEQEPNQDFSAVFTTLQQELYSSFASPPCTVEEAGRDHKQTTTTSSSSAVIGAKEHEEEDDDGDGVRVMIRRLLEASDDELGIPKRVDQETKSEENRPLCDGLWELEDEAANYSTIFHLDLFM